MSRFFLALGLEPVASWFVNRTLPRWAAATIVLVLFLAGLGAFVAAAVSPLMQQATELIKQAPHYLQLAQDHSSAIGRLGDRLHLQQRIPTRSTAREDRWSTMSLAQEARYSVR